MYTDENILYFNEDSGNVVFSCNEMGILNIDLNNINLDINVNENDPDTIILIRLLTWHVKFEKCKALKKRLVKNQCQYSGIPKDGGTFACQKMRKKEIKPIFIERL